MYFILSILIQFCYVEYHLSLLLILARKSDYSSTSSPLSSKKKSGDEVQEEDTAIKLVAINIMFQKLMSLYSYTEKIVFLFDNCFYITIAPENPIAWFSIQQKR